MKDLSYYLDQKYDIDIKFLPDNLFCAEIKDIPGLCAYGDSPKVALEELEYVKRTAFELMFSQNKEIPLPSIKLQIPISIFEMLPFKKEIEKYAVL